MEMEGVMVVEALPLLMRCPSDATMRGYEGEMRGIIVEVGDLVIAYIHNDRTIEIVRPELLDPKGE